MKLFDRKNLFRLSITLNVVFVILACGFIIKKGGASWVLSKLNSTPTANNIATANFAPYHYDRKTLFEVLPVKKDSIVFLGDSITNGCEWNELFDNNNIINRGVNKDTTEGILDRIDTIVNLQPKKVFIMAGINDLTEGDKPEKVESNYKRIIEEIKNNSPQTDTYIESMLPINSKINRSTVSTESIKSINDYLEKLSLEYKCNYVDLFSVFQVDGQLNKDLTNDGTHLNGQGYLLWKDKIKDLVY